jgi:hypothetical protein
MKSQHLQDKMQNSAKLSQNEPKPWKHERCYFADYSLHIEVKVDLRELALWLGYFR